jgi:AraC-like DNA-binding protein
MKLINQFLSSLKTELVAVDATEVGKWWDFKNLNSPFSRLYLITEGKGYITHHNCKYELQAGVLHLVPPFTFHTIECEDRMDHYFLHFICELAHGFDLFNMSTYEYNLKLDDPEKYLNFFKRLIDLNPERGIIDANYLNYENYVRIYDSDYEIRENELLANSIETDAIIKLLLCPILRTQSNINTHLEHFNEKFRDVFGYIDSNIGRNIHIEELAKIVHQNPTYFSDRFNEIMGVRPTQYIIRRRVELAQIMLMDSNKNLNEIAFATGFCDLPHFSKTFTKRLGVTPTKYRQFFYR